MEIIKSVDNVKVKLLKSLQTKKYRDITGLYVVEGFNILKDIKTDVGIKEFYVSLSRYEYYEAFLKAQALPFYILDDGIFNSASNAESPIGIMAVAKQKSSGNVSGDTVLILDGIRDPGNLGTILRSALAFNVKCIIAISCSDIYNPKTVRAAMGAVFYADIIELSDYQNLSSLLTGYKLYYLDMEGENIYGFKRPHNLALVVGSEAHGVSENIRALSDKSLSIPMSNRGVIESLNAAVSASIALSLLTNY